MKAQVVGVMKIFVPRNKKTYKHRKLHRGNDFSLSPW